MASIVAAAGGGNWTVGATWVGGVAPSAADDALLTAASGNVTIDTGAVARSLDCLGYTGTLTHSAAVSLVLGDATAGAGNIALKLVAGMTYTVGSATTSFIALASTSATQQTITSGGKTLGPVSILGGGSYILGDGLTLGATSTLTLSAGTFNTGNFAMSLGLFAITGAGVKTLTLGSSAITITGVNGASVNYSGSNCTFTANTAVMTFTGASGGLAGSANWNGLSVVFASAVTDARFQNGPTITIANLTYTNGANKTSTLQPYIAVVVTGTLTITGNSTVNRILMKSDTVGTARTITAAAVSFANVDFQDITAAGAAIPWTGTSMGNALGNSNITFDAPVTQTRTGAGGNWSTAASWTSRVPLPQDNVIVGAGASGTITADMPRLGADVTFAGFAGTASFASVANALYGSINLASGMTVSGTQTLTLAARSSKTVTSNGKTFTQAITLNAPTGTYTLVDALITAGALTLSSGTLDAATFPATALNFVGTAGTVNMGTNTWTLTATTAITVWSMAAGVTVNASTSTILISTVSANLRTFAGGGKTYGTLTYTVAGSTGGLDITGANTFGTLNFSDATNARTLRFTAATTTTVTNWNVNGTPGNLVTIGSATAANHTLSKPGGTVSTDYLSISRSQAQGGAYWYAGANSVDGGNNTGWRFTVPPSAAEQSNFFLMFA